MQEGGEKIKNNEKQTKSWWTKRIKRIILKWIKAIKIANNKNIGGKRKWRKTQKYLKEKIIIVAQKI